jgi:hypothetical protein
MDAWRLRAVERNALAGRQDRGDLDAVKTHGYVTRPKCDGQCGSRCLSCCPPPVYKPRRSRTQEINND